MSRNFGFFLSTAECYSLHFPLTCRLNKWVKSLNPRNHQCFHSHANRPGAWWWCGRCACARSRSYRQLCLAGDPPLKNYFHALVITLQPAHSLQLVSDLFEDIFLAESPDSESISDGHGNYPTPRVLVSIINVSLTLCRPELITLAYS